MRLVHWIIGALCGILTLGLIAALQFQDNPDAQRLVVTNAFEDADCRIEFSDGSAETFKLKRDGNWKRTFQAPRRGFVTMRCRTASKTLESPASFHLRDGQLATLAITPQGVAELTYSSVPK